MQCINHPHRNAVWLCPSCQTAYCNDCADITMYGTVKLEVCPKCREKLGKLDQFKPPPPFWTRLPEIFAYPFMADGWMRILGIGIAGVVLQSLAIIGMLGGLLGMIGSLFLMLMYSGIVLSYFYLVIGSSEAGKLEPPHWSSFSSITDYIRPVFQYFLTSMVVFMPSLLFFFILLGMSGFNIGGAAKMAAHPISLIIFLITGLTGIAILPMGLLLLGVFQTARLAWNPVIIFGQILKIPKEYAALLGFLFLFLIFAFIVYIVMSLFMIPIGRGVFATIIQLFMNNVVDFYFLVVFGHILGYTAYQSQYKLGWWKSTRDAKQSMQAAPPAVHSNLDEGLELLAQGATNRAADMLEVVLNDEPANRQALKAMLIIRCRQRSEDQAREVAERFFAIEAQYGDGVAATDAYLEMVSAFPRYALPAKYQIKVAKWLQGQGKFIEAAAAYRQYAVAYPEDAMAAKALYQCGDLLLKKCNQAQNAQKIFEYILKRYPQSELANYVRQELVRIQTSTAS